MTEPIARIEKALTDLGAEHEPPLGWETRVLAAVAAPKPRRWWWLAAPAVSLAAVAVVILAMPSKPAELMLSLKVDKNDTVVRDASEALRVGDVVHAIATGGGPNRAVWIYRDKALEVVCPGASQCRSSDVDTIVDVTTIVGNYDIVALTSDSPLPSATGDLDSALAIKTAGVELKRKHLLVH